MAKQILADISVEGARRYTETTESLRFIEILNCCNKLSI
jgi:hypothetical protein